MTAPWIALITFVLVCASISFGVLVAFSRGDRRVIADFGAQRRWRLVWVWWLPAYLFSRGWKTKKCYYRAIFVTDLGTKEKLWFDSTLLTDPVLSAGPFGKS